MGEAASCRLRLEKGEGALPEAPSQPLETQIVSWRPPPKREIGDQILSISILEVFMKHKQHSGRLGLLAALVCIAILAVNLPPNLAAQHPSRIFESRPKPDVRPAEAYASLPLSFEPNVGQAEPGIQFRRL